MVDKVFRDGQGAAAYISVKDMNDEIEQLKVVPPGAGVPEAPIDGEQYARKDADWEIVAGGSGDVEEAPVDTFSYERKDAAWFKAQAFPTAQGSTFLATADTGLSFAKGSVVQLVQILGLVKDIIIDPTDPLSAFGEFQISSVGPVLPNAAYSLPETSHAQASMNSPSFRQYTTAAAGDRIATKFTMVDQIGSVGAPVDWKVVSIRVNQNLNSEEKVNVRFEIWSDNGSGSEPGSLLYDDTNFDWTGFVQGPSSYNVPAIGDLPLLNGVSYWVVGKWSGVGSNGVVSVYEGWGINGGETSGSSYIDMELTGAGTVQSSDSGTIWGPLPETSTVQRAGLTIERTTANTPPSTVFGVVSSNDIDDSTYGDVMVIGSAFANSDGSIVGETWSVNDPLYIDFQTGLLTNIQPLDPLDIVQIGTVLIASPNPAVGIISVTSGVTANRGLTMATAIYDPRNIHKDVFDLDSIDLGTLEAGRVTVDDSGFSIIAGTTSQAVFDNIDDQFAIPLTNNIVSTSYTLGFNDSGLYLWMNNAASNTVVIDSLVNGKVPIGARIIIVQEGVGVTTIQAVAGVTLNGADGGSIISAGQYNRTIIHHRLQDVWVAIVN